MEPIVSKSSQFVERWSRSEYMNAKITFALIAVVAMSLCLTAALVYVSVKPRPVYYVPGAWDAGVALPQSMSQAMVVSFVSSWILNWTNYTPATVQDVYSRAQRFMSPSLLGHTHARLSKDLEQVKRDNISSMFSLSQEPIVTLEKIGFNVLMQGVNGIYLGKDEIKTQKIMYRILVRKVSPTDSNPYGLIIEAIDQEIAA